MTRCRRCASGPPVAMATWRRTGSVIVPKLLSLGRIEARRAFGYGANNQRAKLPSACTRVYLRPRSARVPGATPVFEGLTSDPKQRRSRSVFGDGAPPSAGGISHLRRRAVAPAGDANRRRLLPERGLITTRRGPFTSESL